MDELLYTIEHDGDLFDLEETSAEEAEAWAHEWWYEKYDGEVYHAEDQAYVIGFRYLPDGTRYEESREEFTLEYHNTRSDWDEHNTNYL